jgi:hypothetical protein
MSGWRILVRLDLGCEPQEEDLVMAHHGYDHVTEKGFVAFAHDLREGAWADVSIKAHANAQQMLPSNPMDVPRDVAWKLRATWAIATLRDALGTSPEVLVELDALWDATQRKLSNALGSAAEDRDPELRAAAERLQRALALPEGAGTAKTSVSYDEDVDFGRHQVELMSKGAHAEDVKRLGLDGLRDEIHHATEGLARGVGRGPREQRTAERYNRIRAATAACVAAFEGLHDEIAWFVEHTPQGVARRRLERMLAPFQALLDRYPSSKPAPTEEAPASGPVEVSAAA